MRKTTPSRYTVKKVSPEISPRFPSPSEALFDSAEGAKLHGRRGLFSQPGHTPSTSHSSRGHDAFHTVHTPRKAAPVIGFVSGETSKHFLVKQNSVWIPVAKTAFYSAKGERMSVPKLREVKGKKVKVFHSTSHAPEAHMVGDFEDRVDTDVFTERDLETEPALWDEEGTKALETQLSLSTELLTDVVVLTSLGSDQQRSHRYLQHRVPRLKKSVDQAFSSLRDTGLYASVAPACRQLLANIDLLTSESPTSCGACISAQSHVALSCGHHLCIECASALVAFPSQTEFKLQHCPLCQRELTLTDSRLILLEKYEALKRGMKYVQAIGLDMSHISPH